MSDEGKPPATVVTDLRIAHLTKAVTRKGEIRFDLHVPENDDVLSLAEDLRHGFYLGGMPYVPAREGPILVTEDKRDKAKITVLYRPHGKRDIDEDQRCIAKVFEEMEIPVNRVVAEGFEHAFDALKALNAQGHAAAEVARRSAKKGPRAPRSR
jgi:hypothetical protein